MKGRILTLETGNQTRYKKNIQKIYINITKDGENWKTTINTFGLVECTNNGSPENIKVVPGKRKKEWPLRRYRDNGRDAMSASRQLQIIEN